MDGSPALNAPLRRPVDVAWEKIEETESLLRRLAEASKAGSREALALSDALSCLNDYVLDALHELRMEGEPTENDWPALAPGNVAPFDSRDDA